MTYVLTKEAVRGYWLYPSISNINGTIYTARLPINTVFFDTIERAEEFRNMYPELADYIVKQFTWEVKNI
jgi:hypothetical protein